MGELIGFQSGIVAAMNALRVLDPAHRAAYDKLERTLTILARDHDAAIQPEPPPPPPPARVAPMTHYKTDRADARYCVLAPGVTRQSDGTYTDEAGYRYDDKGLSIDGRRTGNPDGGQAAGLKGADSMDGLEPCDGYEYFGRVFPPWPPASYEP